MNIVPGRVLPKDMNALQWGEFLLRFARDLRAYLEEGYHGTYTPTLTNTANISASTAYLCQWMRVGDVVTVSGRVDITPTATSTQTTLGISLPVASALGADSKECAGTAQIALGVAGGAAIIGDNANDRASLSTVDIASTSSAAWFFQFTYIIT